MDSQKKGGSLRIVAVSYSTDGLTIPFSKSNYFRQYTLIGGKIVNKRILSLFPENNDDSLKQLRKEGCDSIISASFSPRVLNDIRNADMHAYMFSGGPDAAIKAFLADELPPM